MPNELLHSLLEEEQVETPVKPEPVSAWSTLLDTPEAVKTNLPPERISKASRFGKQFANQVILEDIEQSRPSTSTARGMGTLEGAFESLEGTAFGKSGSSFWEQVGDLPKLWWALTKSYYSDSSRKYEAELRGNRGDVPFDVPPPQTTGDKLTDAGAGLTAFLARMVAIKKLTPNEIPQSLRGAVMFEMENASRGGTPGQGALMGGALQGIGAITTKSLYGEAAKVAGESTLMGGFTAIHEDADTVDIMVAAAIPIGLRGLSGARKDFRERFLRAKSADDVANIVRDANFFVERINKAPTEALRNAEINKARQWAQEGAKRAREKQGIAPVRTERESDVRPNEQGPMTREQATEVVNPLARRSTDFVERVASGDIVFAPTGTAVSPRAAVQELQRRISDETEPTAQEKQAIAPAPPKDATNAPVSSTDVKVTFDKLTQSLPQQTVGTKTTGSVEREVLGPASGPTGVRIEAAQLRGEDVPNEFNVVQRDETGTAVGILNVKTDETGNPTLLQVAVREDSRRQGIATALYNEAKTKWPNLEDASGAGGFTEEGRAFAQSRFDRFQNEVAQQSVVDETVVLQSGIDIASLARPLKEPIVESIKALPVIFNRDVRRGNEYIRSLGSPGSELAQSIDRIAFEYQRDYNRDMLDAQAMFENIPATVRSDIAKLVNERLTIEDIPEGWREERQESSDAHYFAGAQVTANRLRELLDRSLDAYVDAGGLRKVGDQYVTPEKTGRAFPQILNDFGREQIAAILSTKPTPRSIEALQGLVDSGRYKTIEQAVKAIREFNEAMLRGVNPYLERTRTELPDEWLEWDSLKVLPGLLTRNWMTVHGTREWDYRKDDKSFPFPKADVLIQQIESQSPTDALRIREFIRAAFGIEFTASPEARRLSNTIRMYQFIVKIATSPMTTYRNALDRWAKGATIAPLSVNVRATLRYPPIINHWIRAAKQVQEDMIRSGAVFGHGSIMEGLEPGTVITEAIGKPFSASERGNQVYLALVSRLRIERDIKMYLADRGENTRLARIFQSVVSLSEDSPARVEERLKKAGLLNLSNEQLADIVTKPGIGPDELQAALHRSVRDSTFPVVLSTKRIWWDNHPFVRVMAQFKTWPVEQLGFIYRGTIREAMRGNVLPLLRFIAAVTIAGELYNIIRDMITGRDEALATKLASGEKLTTHELAKTLGKDFLDGGGVGMIADMTWGITDWIAGPSGATGEDLVQMAQDIVQRPSMTYEAAKQFAMKQVSLARQVEGTVTNLGDAIQKDAASTADYNKWRQKSFEFDNKKQGRQVQGAILSVMGGAPDFARGPDTLSYELAAREITAGNIEAAAEYIAVVLKSAEPTERAAKIRGIHQSKQAKSPLGPVNTAHTTEFLQTLDREQQKSAQQTNSEWINRYDRAIISALRMVREEESRNRGKPR